MKDKIVFTGGGTAGHIMPNVALIEHLRDLFEIHYIGSNFGLEREIISSLKIPYHMIDVVKFKRGIYPSNLLIPFKLMRGVNQARKILSNLKPKLVFSKGGFVSLPVTLASICPLICHESDITLGLANKLALKKAKYLCCTYDETAKKYKNGIYTGLPIRKSLIKPKILNLDKKCLLIMGGSLGAKAINDCVNSCLDQLLKRFKIIHITGKGKKNENFSHKDYIQMEFCHDISEIYRKCDICLTRAGATALYELTNLKIPSLVVPLKKASRGDQILNAKHFKSLGLIEVIDEDNLNETTLINALENLLTNKSIQQNLNSNKNINSLSIISNLIINTAK